MKSRTECDEEQRVDFDQMNLFWSKNVGIR